ncbi:MAG TPA: FAD-binding oxidoreductase [Nitrososphaerales archaeon]|nr:FAD-binding oxidoreductase [Nitrososphaerales archaeon]
MPAQYDIIVVGAGIMGVASAYYLKKNNPSKRILVVDRYGAPGQGNTGRSNATFRNTFSSPDNQILSNSAIDFFVHVQQDLKVDIGLEKIGYLWLMDKAQLSRSEPFLRGMDKKGIDIVRYGKEDLKRLLPTMVSDFRASEDAALMDLPPVEGGVFGPKCGRLDPDKLVRFYANEFVKAGGTLAFNTDVQALALGPTKRLGIEGEPFAWQDFRVEGVVVHGPSEETLQAETVVLAGGAWENELLEPAGMFGNVKAKKRQLFSVQANEAKLDGLLRSKGFNPLGLVPLTILPKAGVHFKPVSEENVFWVACEDDVNRPFIDLPEHDLEGYRAERDFYEKSVYPVLTSYFPDFKDSPIKAMWAGLYGYNALDYLPFAFRDHNLIVVGGDSGSGMMKGDSLGRIVDSLYRDEEETLLYGEVPYRTSKLSFEKRDVEREEWVI